jgi:hypothetical protein
VPKVMVTTIIMGLKMVKVKMTSLNFKVVILQVKMILHPNPKEILVAESEVAEDLIVLLYPLDLGLALELLTLQDQTGVIHMIPDIVMTLLHNTAALHVVTVVVALVTAIIVVDHQADVVVTVTAVALLPAAHAVVHTAAQEVIHDLVPAHVGEAVTLAVLADINYVNV